VTLSPAGQVTKFEGFDEFVKKMVGDNEAARAAFKAMGVEDLYAEGVNQTFGFLPGKPGAKGDSWKRSGRYPLMMLGTLKYDTEYAYQGRSDKGEAISFTEKFTYEAPKEMAGFPIKVTKADVKVDTRAGSILFDPTAGRLIQHERSFRFKGTFTREAGEKRQRSTWTRRVPPPSVC
jgi:hypothetical protein